MSESAKRRRAAEAQYEDWLIGDTSIPKLFETSAARHIDREAQWYKGGVYNRSLTPTVLPPTTEGEFGSVTYGTMRDIVRSLSAGFRDLGVEGDTRVGIFADTRMEWAQVDLGLLAAGAIVTTVYPESDPDTVRYLLSDPGAQGVVVENTKLLERVLEVESALELSFIVVMDEVEGYEDRADIHSLAELYDRGTRVFDGASYTTWLDGREPEDLASIIYTSGTTGEPKGVSLTHRNFRSNVNGLRKRFGPRPDRDPTVPTIDKTDRILSFLPLAHVFERVSGHFLPLASGACVAYTESTDTVAEDIQSVRPTSASSVPRVYERIYASLREEAPASVFSRAVTIAREWSRTDEPGPVLRFKHAVMDRLVYSSVREQMGDNVEFFVSGGGSLSKRLSELFDGMGLPIFEGYGLTETAPVVSVNPPAAYRPGTLGPPLSNVEIRLDETKVPEEREDQAKGRIGELLIRSPNVTPGYWNNLGANERAFTDDGWFRTGDIIEETADRYLIYHDRIKQLIVLDTGKNVAPQPIEDEFATVDRVKQAMVVGNDRKFVAALFVPDFETIARWADSKGIDLPSDQEQICNDESVREFVKTEIDAVNRTLTPPERIKDFRLIPVEWTPDNDLLTPSMKIKRYNVIDRFEAQIEDIYGESAPEL